MATAEANVARGFKACCILCGNNDPDITLRLHNVTEFECQSCGETFTADDVRRHLDGWRAVLNWVDMAPVVAGAVVE